MKVKGVNDSKYVAVIIYVTSLILAVSAVASFVLTEYLNAYASLFALGLGLGATTVIAFVFIPNVIMLYASYSTRDVCHGGGGGHRIYFLA